MQRYCLRCGERWEPRVGSEPCRGCGDADWATEFPMESLSPRTPYYVMREVTNHARVTTLELWGVRNIGARAQAQLSKRLKDKWRKIKDDHRATSGTELIVSFDRIPSGPEANLWDFHQVWRQRDPKARLCERHTWGLFAGLHDYNLNAFAHLMACSCVPGCAICSIGEAYSSHMANNRGAISMTELERLRQATRREISLD